MYLAPYQFNLFIMYARVALAELCLLGQNQNISILGSFLATVVAVYFHNNQRKITLQRQTMYHPSKGEGNWTAIPSLSIIDIRVWREGKFVLTCPRPHSARGLNMHACLDSM